MRARRVVTTWALLPALMLMAAAASTVRGATPASDNDHPDVIIFATGERLAGHIVKAGVASVEFDSAALGPMTIPWARVSSIEVSKRRWTVDGADQAGPRFEPASGECAQGELTVRDGGLTFTPDGRRLALSGDSTLVFSPPSEPEPQAAQSVSSAASGEAAKRADAASAPKPVTWVFRVAPLASTGSTASLGTGTQRQQSFGGLVFIGRDVNATAKDAHHRYTELTLTANNGLTEQAGQPSIRLHQYAGRLEQRFYLGQRVYLHGVAEGYDNSSLNLYLEQSYGGGLVDEFYKTAKTDLQAVGDFLDIGEHFYGKAPGVNFAAARTGLAFNRVLGNSKAGAIRLYGTASYVPALNLAKAWQARGHVMLLVPVNNAVSLQFGYDDDYMENAPNASKNWSTSSVGVTFKLAKSSSW